jgi:hypothetical protein
VAKFCWGTLMASEWVGMLNKHRFHASSPRWNQTLAYDCAGHLKLIWAPQAVMPKPKVISHNCNSFWKLRWKRWKHNFNIFALRCLS